MRAAWYAEVAKVLLRLLDGGTAAKPYQAADENYTANALRRLLDGGSAAAAAVKAEDGGAETETEEPETLLPAEPAEAAARCVERAMETAARRRETELEARAIQSRYESALEARASKSQRGAENGSAKEQEGQRLGETLEALSTGRLRALFPEPEPGQIETGGVPFRGTAAGYGGDVRAGSTTGTRAGTRVFPSSGNFTTTALGGDPEAVSEFFRRDSRRYDAGFGGV